MSNPNRSCQSGKHEPQVAQDTSLREVVAALSAKLAMARIPSERHRTMIDSAISQAFAQDQEDTTSTQQERDSTQDIQHRQDMIAALAAKRAMAQIPPERHHALIDDAIREAFTRDTE